MIGDKIYYKSGFKYQLARCYSILTTIIGYDIKSPYIELTPKGVLTINKGYAWDGASGPTIDTKSSMRGSLVHDAFYQLEREELISQKERKKIDVELHDICVEDGMWGFRADIWLWAVRKFGIFAASPENDHPPTEAP
jgi:hypothetical protein